MLSIYFNSLSIYFFGHFNKWNFNPDYYILTKNQIKSQVRKFLDFES